MPSKLKLESTPVVETVAAKTTGSEVQIGANRQSDETLADTEQAFSSEELTSEHERITWLAYSYWQERGCAEGSPEQDWFLAEQVIQLGKLAKHVGRETSTLPLEQTLSKSA